MIEDIQQIVNKWKQQAKEHKKTNKNNLIIYASGLEDAANELQLFLNSKQNKNG